MIRPTGALALLGALTTLAVVPLYGSENEPDPVPRAELPEVTITEFTVPPYAIMEKDAIYTDITFTAKTSDPSQNKFIEWTIKSDDPKGHLPKYGETVKFMAFSPRKYTVSASIEESTKESIVTVLKITYLSGNVTRAKESPIKLVVLPADLGEDWSFEWTFTGGKGGTKTTSDPETSVILVDGETDYTVSVKLLHTKYGEVFTQSTPIVVHPRSDGVWENGFSVSSVTNTVDHGSFDVIEGKKRTGARGCRYGDCRDLATKSDAIIYPNNANNGVWAKGLVLGEVNDENGPNHGYHYVVSHQYHINQEVIVNKYLTARAKRPKKDVNWFKKHESFSNDFVHAVEKHGGNENWGNNTGHMERIREALQKNGIKFNLPIEAYFTDGGKKFELKHNVEDYIRELNGKLKKATAESTVSGNFSDMKSGLSHYDSKRKKWGPKTNPVKGF